MYYTGNNITNYGTLKGAVTNSSAAAMFGAAVTLESTNGNLTAGTVTLTNGSYLLNAIPPGSYNLRVTPLDSYAADRLIAGPDINGTKFSNANTNFLSTTNIPVTVTAGTTNTLNVTVTAGTPAFRITLIQAPAPASAGSFDIISSPVTISPGQSNYLVGVLSDTLPTNGASFSITGDGITLSGPNFVPNADGVGDNWIYATIGVSSNATPGLRTFLVTQGTNRAYANGFLEVLPRVFDYNFDGLDDVFQRKYFFPFTSTNAAPTMDSDGDSMNNYAEYIAGTIPTNSTSLLTMQSVTATNTGYVVRWQSVSGKRYQIWAQTNLASGSWFTVGSPATASNSTAQLTDTTATNTARFYRVQPLP